MKLPEESSERLRNTLHSRSLLDETAIRGLIESLNGEKPVNWNLVLSKQFESEQGGRDEAES